MRNGQVRPWYEGFLEPSERPDGPAAIAFWGADDAESAARIGAREYGWHSHLRGQLFCVESGLVHVRTPHGSWLLPPNRAGWIPPGMPHMIAISGVLSGWGVLVRPDAADGLPALPCVVGVSDLTRALVRRVVGWSGREPLDAADERIIAVLLEEIARAPHETLHLPLPADRRLARIAAGLAEQPGDERTLDQWCAEAGLSTRTARRLFRAETGMSFTGWRQQARLVRAMERLAAGEPVSQVSDALGYATPSNFIAMFRRAFGHPPARYFSARKALARRPA